MGAEAVLSEWSEMDRFRKHHSWASKCFTSRVAGNQKCLSRQWLPSSMATVTARGSNPRAFYWERPPLELVFIAPIFLWLGPVLGQPWTTCQMFRQASGKQSEAASGPIQTDCLKKNRVFGKTGMQCRFQRAMSSTLSIYQGLPGMARQ